ncbi:hypothetical protein M758_8G050900 [Ceratodon purpureus]|nr:hypothetical protein M758_8G050900 [Ceratodon purpureus]
MASPTIPATCTADLDSVWRSKYSGAIIPLQHSDTTNLRGPSLFKRARVQGYHLFPTLRSLPETVCIHSLQRSSLLPTCTAAKRTWTQSGGAIIPLARLPHSDTTHLVGLHRVKRARVSPISDGL